MITSCALTVLERSRMQEKVNIKGDAPFLIRGYSGYPALFGFCSIALPPKILYIVYKSVSKFLSPIFTN